jgi:hypothetical protein
MLAVNSRCIGITYPDFSLPLIANLLQWSWGVDEKKDLYIKQTVALASFRAKVT